MNAYHHRLPASFPYVVIGTPKQIGEAITALIDLGRPDVSNGSSFAMTINIETDLWNLWLSETSYMFVEDCVKQGMWKRRPDQIWPIFMKTDVFKTV